MSVDPLAIALVGDRVVIRLDAAGPEVPKAVHFEEVLGPGRAAESRVIASMRPVDERTIHLFDLGEDFDLPSGFALSGIRELHGMVPDSLFRAVGTARQKIDWLRSHRFCSRCGTPAELSEGHEGIECPSCGQLHFPRIAPAVIVLVQRGREALLGRSPRFKPGVYSTLAGFVEPGESLEECVHREIEEEVGVRVGDLRYFGSQPHPFPHSLMVGFIAEWKSGAIRMDPAEIEDARWFTPETLPDRPHPMSIARALIDDFVHRVQAQDR